MEVHVIGSSSRGNCYILETPTDWLMLECGVNFRDTQKTLNFDLSKIVGCLVTHEHQDHCKSIKDVIKNGIDCYMSNGTDDAIGYESHRIKTLRPNLPFGIGDFTILPFDVQHDCTEPLGYLIMYKPTGEKLLFVTDTYYIKYKYKNLNYIMVECNHIADLIENSVIRNRLMKSHFSLENVKDFLTANDMGSVRKIILLHLSGDNSDARRMIKEIEDLTKIDTEVADSGKIISLEMQPF